MSKTSCQLTTISEYGNTKWQQRFKKIKNLNVCQMVPIIDRKNNSNYPVRLKFKPNYAMVLKSRQPSNRNKNQMMRKATW